MSDILLEMEKPQKVMFGHTFHFCVCRVLINSQEMEWSAQVHAEEGEKHAAVNLTVL